MTVEKVNRYFNRTLEHIHRVQKNMFMLITKYPKELYLTHEEKRQLAYSVLNHDRSKFNKVQFRPYIELNEYYYQRKNLGNKDYEYPSKEIKDRVDCAAENHYHNENHHPEKHAMNISGFSENDIIEVICDLQAMAQEFNEGSCRGYFETVWQKKYKLGGDHHLIYADTVIECFEKELNNEN